MAHQIRPGHVEPWVCPPIISLLVAFWLGGCSNDPASSADGTDGGIDSSGSGTEDGTVDAGEGDGDPTTTGDPQPCIGDAQCPNGQTCGQASGECLPPGGCALDGDCPSGQTCADDSTCEIGGGCGGFEFSIEAVPPNLLILLDRSGSMNASVPNSNLNRWEVAKQAIAQVTTTFDEQIRFGLATYSACVGNGCSAGTTVVPIADQNAAAINAFLDMTVGSGSSNGAALNNEGKIRYLCDSGDPETSTGSSLQAQLGSPPLQDSSRDNAILLITDGAESGQCIMDGINGAVAAANLFGQTIPVKTFAVGFGGANLTEIDAIATAGGTMTGYQADQADQLSAALEQIATAVATCTFELDQVPPDVAQIYVFFDKDPAGVPNHPDDGWTYDPLTNTVSFHGPACDAIKSGAVVEIDIVYGCNEPPIG